MVCLAQMNLIMPGWMKALPNLQLTELTAFLNNDTEFPHQDNYSGYYSLVKSGREEPLTTHADHFNTNLAYGYCCLFKRLCVSFATWVILLVKKI